MTTLGPRARRERRRAELRLAWEERAERLRAETNRMTVGELRHEAGIAALVDAGLAVTLLNAALRRSPNDPDLLWDKARIQYGAHALLDCARTLQTLLDQNAHLPGICLLEKVLRRLGRSDEASAWYVRRLHLVAALTEDECGADSAGPGLGAPATRDERDWM